MKTKTKKVAAEAPVSAKKDRPHGVCVVTGEPTSSPKANFKPGMDARLKGMLLRVLRGEAELKSIPKAAIAKMRENGAEGLVGFRFGRNDKLEHIGNFAVAEKAPATKTKVKSKVKSARKEKAARQLQAIEDDSE